MSYFLKLLSGIIILKLLFPIFLCNAQFYKRIEATYSVKEKLPDGSQYLQVGKVYYDATNKIIYYKITFPQKESLIVSDTLIVSINADGKKRTVKGEEMVSFSVFDILLKGDLPYYGLQNLLYQMMDVHNEDTLIVSTWVAFKSNLTSLPKIMLAQYNKKLYSFIGFNSKEEIVLKQFFENYQDIEGLAVPTKIVTFNYTDGKESIKWLSLSEIKVNNFDDNENYSRSVKSALQ
jgi:hypothetical protein